VLKVVIIIIVWGVNSSDSSISRIVVVGSG